MIQMIQIGLTDAVIICNLHIITASVKLICIMLTAFCCRQLTAYTPCNVEIIRSVRLAHLFMNHDPRCVETVCHGSHPCLTSLLLTETCKNWVQELCSQ